MTTCDTHSPSLPCVICAELPMTASVLSPIVVPPAFLSRPSGDRPPKASLRRYVIPSYEACPAPAKVAVRWGHGVAAGGERDREMRHRVTCLGWAGQLGSENSLYTFSVGASMLCRDI